MARNPFRYARIGVAFESSMLPPFLCSSTSGADWRQQHQKRKLEMLRFWRDGLERQLAAINASIQTLEGQIDRDSSSQD